MFPESSSILVSAIVLSLFWNMSSCQDWETFQKKHLTSTLDIDCDNVMSRALFHCKKCNTFIYSRPEPVKAICRGIEGPSDVLTRSKFMLINCNPTTKYCHYKYKKENNVVCVTCEKSVPVHFVNVGSCDKKTACDSIGEGFKDREDL